MPIEDSGYFTRGGYSGTQFRDVIVWPPGWQPPAATETITLGAATTVPAAGLLIGASVTSAGERWQAASALPKTRRLGWVPSSSAGAYASGATLPMYRTPRFAVGHRTSRGNYTAGFGIFATSRAYLNMVMRTTFRLRSANIAYLTLESTSTFKVGQQIVVSGVGGSGYNGTFTVLASGSNTVTYTNIGPNEGTIADAGGRLSVLSLSFRVHQFDSLRPWVRTTGPQTVNADGGSSISTYTWNKAGILLRLISRIIKPFDVAVNNSQYFSQLYQVWAPVAAEETPDFCIDVDLPSYQTMRIIWFSVFGYPQAAFPSVYDAAPYAGATRLGRCHSHTDRWSTSNNGNTSIVTVGLKEDAGIVRAISSLATPITTIDGSDGSKYAIRPSLIPSTIFSHFGPSSAPTAGTVNSCLGQWKRVRANGTVVNVGASFAVAYTSYVSGPNFDYWIKDTIPALVDASRGDTPGYYFFRVEFDFTNSSGGRSTIIYDGLFNGFWLHAATDWNPLHPWPWDVPLLTFADNEASVRYTGNTGWIMDTPVSGVVTIVPPGLSRAGTTITAASGTATAADATENVVSTTRSVLLRSIAPTAPVGGETGGASVSGAGVPLTVAGFSGHAVLAEVTDVWQVTSSGVGQTGSIFDIYTAKTNATLP